MADVHLVLGVSVVTVNLVAGLLGSVFWWRASTGTYRSFWVLARIGQGLLVLQVVLGGVLVSSDYRPADSLHFVYGLLPVGVVFIAEQLRVASAEAVLHSRGYSSAQEVGELPEADQHSVVTAIVRRELGVTALAALAVGLLALRAAFTSGAF